MMYEERTYRHLLDPGHLVTFQVRVKETDLLIHAARPMEERTRELVLRQRRYLEQFISTYPEFATTLVPWPRNDPAPEIVSRMIDAGRKAGVGPMAAVAGAVAESVGQALLQEVDEVIVENGGDVFIQTNSALTVGIYAGDSPLSHTTGLTIPALAEPLSVCTSSGTVGHSLSLGNADAVCVVSRWCALADAAATAIGNHVRSAADIRNAIEEARQIDGLNGGVIIVGDTLGVWGTVELVALGGKKA
ncbi:protein of unknown function DUF375 [Olavius algarvensis associated proteobacterium Delta 3]|nr:protein of unknown function DUF375 [Olavius algarvensis associated proteobacterium Delta 3]